MHNRPLVNKISEIKLVLNSINWNFYPKSLSPTRSQKLFDCRKYHWYPATFIPEIPYTLIELLTKPGARIFDPFSGIGTTYFQALLLNRYPVAADISSFSVDFTKLLLSLFNPYVDLTKEKRNILSKIEGYNPRFNYTKITSQFTKNKYLDELRCWYTPKNFNTLCFLILLERKMKNSLTRAALKLSISSILSTVSNQDRGWGCIADNVHPKEYQVKEIDVIKVFLSALDKLITDIEGIKSNIDFKAAYRETIKRETVFHSNITTFNKIPENTIDIVITSPPYPNMVDYITSQRLSYYYFDYDIDSDRKYEIGARYTRKRKNSLNMYQLNMNQASRVIARTIKKDGLMCYIMPSFNTENENNCRRRSIVQAVISELEKIGLTKEIEIERSIPSLKRSHNSKWATLNKEMIYIFRKL